MWTLQEETRQRLHDRFLRAVRAVVEQLCRDVIMFGWRWSVIFNLLKGSLVLVGWNLLSLFYCIATV